MEINSFLGSVYKAIFTGEETFTIGLQTFKRGPSGRGGLFRSRTSGNKILRGFSIGEFTFMEQNPETPFGQKNKDKKIMYAFRKGDYICKVVNGIIYDLTGGSNEIIGHI